MKTKVLFYLMIFVAGFFLSPVLQGETSVLALRGISVTPHMLVPSMRYARAPEPATGALVQLFLHNDTSPQHGPLVLDEGTAILFENNSPAELLQKKLWAWHDTPAAIPGESLIFPPETLTVWSFNGSSLPFGPGGRVRMKVGPETAPWLSESLHIAPPECRLSAITFLGADTAIQPDIMVVHVANASKLPVNILSCRLWLPPDPKSPRILAAQAPLSSLEGFNGHLSIPSLDRGGFTVKTGPLPLTYAAVEVALGRDTGEPLTVWAYLRVKPERFDISGGWVNGKGNPVASETFLKALKRLYINTAHLAITPGYSDTELYARYPLKYFNRLAPFDLYDTDDMLPCIHAVEFLGEPQYGGGRPVPPQEVWEALQPYTPTRLPTTVTHSEERVWRDYAGLSDYPHYDAYRVTAPSPDAWHKYERWDGKRISWGAPLETIGDMCRSLRELNRPKPCAIWSQGPHEGWDRYGGRRRTSPTPDEIRLQAYHALSTRITSLYWFNLSLKTLVQWRDTLEELGRIGRELRLLDAFLLEGDAYGFERLTREGNRPDWDIASVCGPRGALLFALDLDYTPDPEERVFKFGSPRPAQWRFPLPAYLGNMADVFRLDADGIYDAAWSRDGAAVEIQEQASRVVVYIATPDAALRGQVEQERQQLIAAETALQFDPARNDADFRALEKLLASLPERDK